MNISTISEESEKSWDHPWTTDEMRQYRSNWSLAGDVGLLRHLQQFSENLTVTVKNTQTTLDLLSNQLNETTVLIDNVTNASLALANTQFIESRVYEDDTDNTQKQDDIMETDINKLPNNELMSESEMISIVSENIKQGIAIMDEKYERLEVLSSDTEDENETSQQSFILRPKDPYQNRPLPYVIGTDKWKASNKIGLESSSSESEMVDEDEDDDDNDDDDETENDRDMDELSQHIFIENSRRISILRRTSSSSSSSESSDFNDKSITNKQYSGTSSHTDNKLYSRSQDTLNSTSELTTPTVELSKNGENISRDMPSFAEELAKRLGNVIPSSKRNIEQHNTYQSSINCHTKDDLFTNNETKTVIDNADVDDDEDIFSAKSTNFINNRKGLFDDDDKVSNSIWEDKPIKRPQTNIIPPSIDVPPPMHSTEPKQKSALDDLFGDSDSDDSDDIFSPKIKNKSTTKSTDNSNVSQNTIITSDTNDRKLLGGIRTNTDKIATSTPETNNDVLNLFEDDENDGNLFSSPQKLTTSRPSHESSLPSHRNRPPGILVSQSDLLSSTLGSRLLQHARHESTDSSENECLEHQPNTSERENNSTDSNENPINASTIGASSIEVGNGVHIASSDSSGISIHPQSINSTLSFGGVNNWTPQMESTRLASEELYRERITSDSLLNSKIRQQNNNNSESTIGNSNCNSNHNRESSNAYEKNLFENNNDNDDNVFSPPPLPKNQPKSESKVKSLFDDSDSGDDLFSNTSSGSRSQKSTDILTNSTQQQPVEKSKSGPKRSGLFNVNASIFANKDADLDIFTSGSNLKDKSQSSTQSQSPTDKSKISITDSVDLSKKLLTCLSETTNVKPTSIFDDSETEDDDLFSTVIRSKSMVNKFNDENNLFATVSVSSANQDVISTVPKKDSTAETVVVGDKESKVKSEESIGSNDQLLAIHKVSNNRIGTAAIENKLFDDSDESDDNLFSQSKKVSSEIKSQKNLTIITDKFQEKESNSVTESIEPEKELFMESVNTSKEFDIIQSQNKIKSKSESMAHSSDAVASENPNLPLRRAPSAKMLDLKAKMVNLKFLSPTDTPLLWRKSGDMQNSEDNDNTPDRDSEDGSSISMPSTKSLPTLSRDKIVTKKTPQSPSIEIESAVSFDTPAQADTLTVTASKSRAKIPVKRRPQSRHARQTALRTSGIDFDTVDTVADSFNIIDRNEVLNSQAERFATSNDGSDGDDDESLTRPAKPTLNFISDDKSEFSLGKESSFSITKNTLLSPSTDEEDLFDVPPDLPEDSHKEDSLFGQAPILSPIPKRRQGNSQNRIIDELENFENKIDLSENESIEVNKSEIREKLIEDKTESDNEKKSIDPLRDGSHDPLKDPSQLFAFVTKTPSPEKGQNVSFNEDDSLFSQRVKKVSGDTELMKKSSLDIFATDPDNDLFSGPFTKTITKKSMKGTKTNLFNDLDSDDDDGTDDLFGSASSKRSNQSKSEHSDIDVNEISNVSGNSPKQADVFDDDDDEDLFFDASEKPSSETGKDDNLFPVSNKVSKSKLEDIFGDSSDNEHDIFTIKKPIGQGTTGDGLFFNDDNDTNTGDIFVKKLPSNSNVAAEPVGNRVPVRKAVTRDLRKTAEKIIEDPLSMLHDD